MRAPDASEAPRTPTGAATTPAPPTAAAVADAEWDGLTLASFGPRHWNLGCG